MRKKFLAYLLAAGMVLAVAPVIPAGTTAVSTAAEVNIEKELDCSGWWVAHTKGVEIGAEGVAIKFKSKTYDAATNNWNTPVLVVYSSEDGAVHAAGDAGYTEYAVIRSDSFAWNGDKNTGDGLAAWTAAGYEFTAAVIPETFVADNKAGVECSVQAIKVGDKVYVQFTNGSVTTVTAMPVPADATVLLSLTGEQCTLTDIEGAEYTGIEGVNAAPSGTTAPSDSTPAPTTEPTDTTPAPTTAPPTTDDDNTPSDDDNTPSNDDEPEEKSMSIKSVTAKKDAVKVTGTVSVAGAKVQVKVGSKAFKNATVKGKKFTFKTAKLKKGTKVTVKATKDGYKTATKKVTVK